MHEIKLDYLTIEYKEPIVYHHYTRSVVIDRQKIQEINDADEKLTQGKPYLLLSDARAQIEITPEGNEAVMWTGNIIANAVVVKWLAQRLVAKVFSEFNKPPHPFAIFTDEAEAVKWLLQHNPANRNK